MNEQAPLSQRVLEAVRSGKARPQVKLAAARGALPLTPAQLVELQVLLYGDSDSEIAAAAKESLEAISPEAAVEMAGDEDTGRDALHFLAGWLPRWMAAGPELARRTDLAVETLQILGNLSHPETLDSLTLNMVVLSREPDLAKQLLQNPALPSAARSRLLDAVDEIDKVEARARAAAEAAAAEAAAEKPADAPTAEGTPPAKDPFLAALGVDAEVEAILPELGIDIAELSERSELLGELEEGDDESLITRLSRMNVGQKLRIALFGSKEERNILVRDSNRIVACSVVKNPKFTDAEAEAVAKSRNVTTDVLRLIARHRDFAKNYSIQRSLVNNPRTPREIATHFINFLNDRDLKMLMKSRNVPDTIRRHARKMWQVREARRAGRRPGH